MRVGIDIWEQNMVCLHVTGHFSRLELAKEYGILGDIDKPKYYRTEINYVEYYLI